MARVDEPFFAPITVPDDPEPDWDPLSQPDWARVPWEVEPAVCGQPAVVARTDAFAILRGPLVIYDRGLLLELTLIRNPWGSRADARLMQDQHGPHGAQPGGFRAGVRWADGRTARTDDRRGGWTDDQPAASMMTRGGGGSGEATGTTWWVWPLPAEGDLELVVEFTAGGIPETRHALDGAAIRAAAARAAPIWQAPGLS